MAEHTTGKYATSPELRLYDEDCVKVENFMKDKEPVSLIGNELSACLMKLADEKKAGNDDEFYLQLFKRFMRRIPSEIPTLLYPYDELDIEKS